MHLLLLFGDPFLRNVCKDFFAANGCAVDGTGDAAQAEALLRFRRYDLVLADLPRNVGREEVLRLLTGSHRGENRVLLTTLENEVESGDDSLVVLTKPKSLHVILGMQWQNHGPIEPLPRCTRRPARIAGRPEQRLPRESREASFPDEEEEVAEVVAEPSLFAP